MEFGENMPENVKKCPLCQSTSSDPFDTRKFREHTVANRVCANCGLVYQSPRMTAVELNTFYTAEYRQIYQGDEGPTQKDLQTQKGRASALLKFVAGFIPKVERHLDIGCSAGILLETFCDHYENFPLGIEPGDTYRKFAQDKGITVYTKINELLVLNEPRSDLISMAHVLEHLPDPVGYLVDLRENYLTPEGWLLLEVPNLFCHDSFETAHLVSFSSHTLRQTIQKAGFNLVKLEAHGRPRSEILPLYLTVLARPGKEQATLQIRSERGVAFKRHLGLFRRRVLQKLFPKEAWKW